MARQKHRSQLDSMNEINMTPLIDLTFLLLIIFMITAPLLENAINVSPPEMSAEQIKDDKFKVVTLNHDGEISWNKQIVSPDTLIQQLRELKQSDPKITIMLRADGDRRYKEVINLMKTIKSSGFSNISLITQAE